MSTRIPATVLSAVIIFLVAGSFYSAIVIPIAFSGSFGDYESYSQNFAAFAALNTSSLSLMDFMADDLLFYLAIVVVLGVEEYSTALILLIVGQLILYTWFFVAVRQRGSASIALDMLFLFVLLNPKFFELLFFGVRQGISMGFILVGLYGVSSKRLMTVGVVVAIACHATSVVILLAYMLDRIAALFRGNIYFWICAFFVLVFCITSIYFFSGHRFVSGWQPSVFYSIAILITMSTILWSAIAAKSTKTKAALIFFCVLVLVGPMLDIPTDRFVSFVLLLFWSNLQKEAVTQWADLVAIATVGLLTTASLGLWL